MPSGRSVGRLAGWLAATAVSMAATWAALQPVLDAAVPDRLNPLTGPELRARPALAAPTTTPEVVVDAPAPTAATSSPAPAATASPPAAAATAPSPDAAETAADPVDSATTDDGWTVVEDADGSVSYLQSFDTEGGTAVISLEPEQASLVSATPVEPYSVDVYHEEPERLIVKFFTANHMFVIDAIWWEDRPYAEVSEVS